VVRDAILRGRNWRQVAERAKKEHFGKEAGRMARERMEAMLKVHFRERRGWATRAGGLGFTGHLLPTS
jgi:hypothetical protein